MAFTSTAEMQRPMLDTVVFLAMAVIAFAFAAALIHQSILGFMPAVVAGAVLFAVMASTQFAVNRALRRTAMDDRLDQLEEALEILDADLQRIDQVEDDVARLDLLNDRVERLDKAITGARSDELDDDLTQVDRLAADFETLHGRLDALRSDLESEARVQRDKISEELRVLKGLIRQLGKELTTASGAIPSGAGEVYRAQLAVPPAVDEAEEAEEISGTGDVAEIEDVEALTLEVTDELELAGEPERDEEEPLELGAHSIAWAEGSAEAAEESTADPAPLDTVREAIEKNRIELYVQPTVILPEREPRYFEAFTRLKTLNDDLILPATFIGVAEPASLMPLIDNVMLVKSVQFLRRLGSSSKVKGVFCNLSVQSLLDNDYFPELVKFMEENSSLSDSLFLELRHNAIRDFGADELENINALGKLGFRFSLDHVADLDVDLAGLRDRNFRFVKIEAQTVLHDMGESDARIPASDLKSYLEDFDLELIVEKVEDELSLLRLMDYGVELAQGYLFAEPEPVSPKL